MEYMNGVPISELPFESRANITQAVDASGDAKVDKVLCSLCNCLVNPLGHEERCRVPVPSFKLELQRKRAWFGDAWHLCHVRWLLIKVNTPVKELQLLSQQFLSAEDQARWYNQYDDVKARALGTSVHSVSTAFEASYYLFQKFRGQYLIDLALRLNYHLTLQEMTYLMNMFAGEDYISDLYCVDDEYNL